MQKKKKHHWYLYINFNNLCSLYVLIKTQIHYIYIFRSAQYFAILILVSHSLTVALIVLLNFNISIFYHFYIY